MLWPSGQAAALTHLPALPCSTTESSLLFTRLSGQHPQTSPEGLQFCSDISQQPCRRKQGSTHTPLHSMYAYSKCLAKIRSIHHTHAMKTPRKRSASPVRNAQRDIAQAAGRAAHTSLLAHL